MCGINGFITRRFSNLQLEDMTDALSHRGPDARGNFCDNFCGVRLGHRRLSILDTSEIANQPFYSQCGRYIMVYNGEVYNFREIRKTIQEKKGICFKTTGDTEVIIEAFAIWGKEFVHLLNGMFAIAIYDKLENCLWLFRDRLGIKPLYYYLDENVFAFASEIKGLLALKYIRNRCTVSKETVANFLHLGYPPDNTTFYEEINKFPAGAYGFIRQNDLNVEKYWQPESHITEGTLTDEREAKSKLHKLIEESVAYRLISDVPVGTFLSGGTDSSIVTAIANKLHNKPIKTFSIGFKEAKFNEAEYARQVAEYLKTEHYEFILSEQEALAQLDHYLKVTDEPFADASLIPTLLVSQMARQHVTVALSGDGGDELFMGYGMYQWARRLLAQHSIWHRCRVPLSLMLRTIGNNKFQRVGHLLNFRADEDLKSHIFSQEQYFFTHLEIENLLNYSSHTQRVNSSYELARKLNPMERQALYDLKNYLKDDLLVKVDRASMWHSLEVRVPLLDYRIVEFALNLDSRLKVRNGTTKYLLKQVLYEYIPPEIIERPKWGFGIPLAKWLKTDLKYLIDLYLTEEVVSEVGLLKYPEVKNLVNSFFKGKDFFYNRIWAMALLHKWYIENSCK